MHAMIHAAITEALVKEVRQRQYRGCEPEFTIMDDGAFWYMRFFDAIVPRLMKANGRWFGIWLV